MKTKHHLLILLAWASVALSILAQPVILVPPHDQTHAVGTTATFTLVATGAPPVTCQWGIVNFEAPASPIPGATNTTLVLTNVQVSRRYQVAVSNALGGVVAEAVLNVGLPAVITLQPADTSVEAGSPVTLAVGAGGSTPHSYQWYLNGTLLPGRTTSQMYFSSVQPSNAGIYRVTVQNGYGGTNLFTGPTSQDARLRVVTPGSTFTRILEGPVVNDPAMYWGSAWADYNNDGYPDLFVCYGWTSSGVNRLYRNNGDGTFTRMTASEVGPIVSDSEAWEGCSWADYNNDGWLDAYVNAWPGVNALYRNLGGYFERITDTGATDFPNVAQSTLWGDYDNDGFVDMFAANAWQPSFPHMRLFHNGGDGSFSEVTTGPLVTDTPNLSNVAVWGDIDNDNDLDVVVADYSSSFSSVLLYSNNGNGTFTRISDYTLAQLHAGLSVVNLADYDNDALLDLFVSGGGISHLFHNDGGGRFTLTPARLGYDGGGSFADYDNDGDLDLFFASDMFDSYRNQLYQNNGDGTFTEIKSIAPAQYVGQAGHATWADYDNDGFLDLFVSHNYTVDNSLLYHNNRNTNHWLMFRLQGAVANRAAIGAKVRLKATIFATNYWQMREISAGNREQDDLRAHFGLGDATTAELVRVEWPSGQVTMMTNVPAGQILTITESPIIKPVPGAVLAVTNGTFQFHLRSHPGMVWDLHASDHVHDIAETCAPANCQYYSNNFQLYSNGYWHWQQCVTNHAGTITVTDTNLGTASTRFYKAVVQQGR